MILDLIGSLSRKPPLLKVVGAGHGAINEQMKLSGITPGASFSLDGETFRFGVMIPVSEIRLCLDGYTYE